AYWKQEGQPWRKEPEIDEKRQQYLSERRKIKPDNKYGTYPFKDIRLNRADVEWLLATHENGRGHIDWSDESQRGRYGLDLRGADLRGAYLAYLPLTGMCRVEDELGTLHEMTLRIPRPDAGAVHLEEANLWHAHLERA